MTYLPCFLALVLVTAPVLNATATTSEQPTVQFTWRSKDRSVMETQQDHLRKKGADVGDIQDDQSGPRGGPIAVGFLIIETHCDC